MYELGRGNVLVLAIKVILSTELAWPGFIAFLFAGAAMIACLRGADLLSPCLLTCTPIIRHVRTRRVMVDGGSILLLTWWLRWRCVKC